MLSPPSSGACPTIASPLRFRLHERHSVSCDEERLARWPLVPTRIAARSRAPTARDAVFVSVAHVPTDASVNGEGELSALVCSGWVPDSTRLVLLRVRSIAGLPHGICRSGLDRWAFGDENELTRFDRLGAGCCPDRRRKA